MIELWLAFVPVAVAVLVGLATAGYLRRQERLERAGPFPLLSEQARRTRWERPRSTPTRQDDRAPSRAPRVPDATGANRVTLDEEPADQAASQHIGRLDSPPVSLVPVDDPLKQGDIVVQHDDIRARRVGERGIRAAGRRLRRRS